MTRRDPEPAGANCSTGGVVIRIGVDTNGDDTLEESEVKQTQYVCNGASVLTREDSVAPNAQCPAGGTAVSVGVDDNGDGTLEDGEIDQTTTVCNSTEIWAGDFTAADWSDPVKVAALQGAKIVTGSLVVGTNAPVSLPKLELVNSALTIGGDSVDLPALRQVGGGLSMYWGTSQSVSFPALERVVGDVAASGAADDIAAPALTEIGGALKLYETESGAVSLPVLTTVGGNAEVQGGLATIDLPAVTSVGGDLAGDKNVTHVSAPALTKIGGVLLFGSVPDEGALVSLDLHHLATVGKGVELVDPSLTDLSLPALQSVGQLYSYPAPTAIVIETADPSIDFPALATANGSINVSAKGTLTSLTFSKLNGPDAAIVVDAEPLLANVSASASSLKTLRISGCGHPTLYFPNLFEVGTLDLENENLDNLSGFSELSSIGSLKLDGIGVLRDLRGLEHVGPIHGDLVLGSDDALTSLTGLGDVTSIDDTLELVALPQLTSLDGLAYLDHVGGLVVDDPLGQVPELELSAFRVRLHR